MSIEEAVKIEQILIKYRELEKIACDYQDVTSGTVDEFTITTNNGSVTISSKGASSLGNRVLFEIDALFGEFLDKIEAELNVL